MRLLIITQKVAKNDPILGFFHKWLEEFAKNFEKVTVTCLEKGEYDLPGNVKVLSLGKEKSISRLKYLINFYKYIWQERKNYDAVFVHMNPVYIALGGILWKFLSKKISLWYVHKQVSFKLRIAEKLAHIIFTSSPESFGLKSRKVKYVGHGIAINDLCPVQDRLPRSLTLMHIGRITAIKRCEALIDALKILKSNFSNLKLIFVGNAVTPLDQSYQSRLKGRIKTLGLEENVEFRGNVPNQKIRDQICAADATVNFSPTGGMDKVVLESFSVGVPAFFANFAFLNVVKDRSLDFHITPATPETLAIKITEFFSSTEKKDINQITDYVRENFSITALVSQIKNEL